MIDEILFDAEDKMDKTVEHTREKPQHYSRRTPLPPCLTM